jgi:hypothetical protein
MRLNKCNDKRAAFELKRALKSKWKALQDIIGICSTLI